MSISDNADTRQQLREYLDDEAPPLLVAETIGGLMIHSPKAVTEVVLGWANDQIGASLHAIPFADFLFHAVKKIQLLEEAGVLAPTEHRRSIARLGHTLKAFCPADEQTEFMNKMERVFERGSIEKTVDFLHRTGEGAIPISAEIEVSPAAHGRSSFSGSGGRVGSSERSDKAPISKPLGTAPLDPDSREASFNRARLLAQRSRDTRMADDIDQQQVRLGLRRFSLLIDRIESLSEQVPNSETAIDLATDAAQEAENAEELRHYFDRLKSIGLDNLQTELLFKKLIERLPDWELAEQQRAAPTPLRGIEHVVGTAETREELSRHLEIVFSNAVEHLNEGALNRAQAVLELADRLLRESALEDEAKASIRASAEVRVDPEHFLRLAEQPECHRQLRNILSFFASYRRTRLFKRLLIEPDRKARFVILQMIKVYGQEARAKAAELLQVSMLRPDGSMPWYFKRNLIHLLRQIPRNREIGHARELADVIAVAKATDHPAVLKEAFAYFGNHQEPKSEKALIQHLVNLQRTVSDKSAPRARRAEAASMRALVLGQLLHHQNPRARKVVLDQILSRRRWTNTFSKLLDRLGESDLSDDSETLERMMAFTSAMVFEDLSATATRGLDSDQRTEAALAGIRALRSTTRDDVADLLQDILHSGHYESIEAQARAAIHNLDRRQNEVLAEDEAELEGDIGVFGLPGLLSTLEQNSSSGRLVLVGHQDQESEAILELRNGEFATCRMDSLEGEAAFYAIFQRPFEARFSFFTLKGSMLGGAVPTRNLTALILEATRRHDEFTRSQSIIGDFDLLEIRPDARPTSPEWESDGEMVRELWDLLSTRPTPNECEALLIAEPYRVRRLLCFWLSEQAITCSRPGHRALADGEPGSSAFEDASDADISDTQEDLRSLALDLD